MGGGIQMKVTNNSGYTDNYVSRNDIYNTDSSQEQTDDSTVQEEMTQETDSFIRTSYNDEKEDEDVTDLITKLRNETKSIRDSFAKSKKNNLYDATSDLMAIADAENEATLKSIHIRLLFKKRMIKLTGTDSDEVKAAVRKIQKVIGKTKSKIKKLKKEKEIDDKRKAAEKAKQLRLEKELRRELEIKKRVRKNKEKKDVEESRMGMGDNYDGSSASDTLLLQNASVSSGSSDDMISEGGIVDIVSADVAVPEDVCADMGGSTVDITL